MVNKGLSLSKTSAGQKLNKDLIRQKKKFKRDLANAKKLIQEALAEGDRDTAKEIRRVKDKYQHKFDMAEQERLELETIIMQERARSQLQLQYEVAKTQAPRELLGRPSPASPLSKWPAGDSGADADLGAETDESQSSMRTGYASDGESELRSISLPRSLVFTNQDRSEATSQSSQPEVFRATADRLATMFLEDTEVNRLFIAALDDPKIGGERLERNFRRILVAYSKDLQAIAVTEPQRQASTIVKRGARSVAQSIRRAIDPNHAGWPQS